MIEATDLPAPARRRRLALRGAVNCRDLGGYLTSDGRSVRWGRVFRSDQLADLTAEDLVALDGAGLRTVIDLRAPSERTQKPNRKLLSPVDEHAIGFMPHQGDTLLSGARSGTLTRSQIEVMMHDIYRRFATERRDTFYLVFQLLLQPNALPALIHCTSGRDRTGFASAVLLMALGVPRATIVEDYMLSNDFRRDLTFQIGGAVDPAIMATLTQSLPSYLAASFKAFEDAWGSDAAFLEQGLGLTPSQQRTLQALLLEPATT